MKILFFAPVAILIAGFVFYLGTESSACESDVYSRIVPIGGLLLGEGGDVKTIPGKLILFQRTDCRKCISSVLTDAEGKYVAYLAHGKYEVIVRDCGVDKNLDCLSKSQRRIIQVEHVGDHQYDLKLSREALDVKITPKIFSER